MGEGRKPQSVGSCPPLVEDHLRSTDPPAPTLQVRGGGKLLSRAQKTILGPGEEDWGLVCLRSG